jgi:hypothetical protein
MSDEHKSKRAKPTDADREAAKRLINIYQHRNDVADSRGRAAVTQPWIASQWKPNPITQGAVSQYLNGKTPLNLDAVLNFARILECDPREIRDDFGEKQSAQKVLSALNKSYTPSPEPSITERELDETWEYFPVGLKEQLIRTVRASRETQETLHHADGESKGAKKVADVLSAETGLIRRRRRTPKRKAKAKKD